MNTHIQCLSLLIILLTLNPLSIANLIEFIRRSATNINISIFFRNLTIIYLLLITVVYYLIPESLTMKFDISWFWIAIGILSAPWIIGIEIFTAYIILRLKGEKLSRISIDSNWQNCNIKMGIYTVAIGVLEEIVYRQIWFYLMIVVLDINIGVVIIASSIFYALNHITLGKEVLIQKFISGILFSMLFYFSGLSIVVPVLCHGLQNLLVVIRGSLNESIS